MSKAIQVSAVGPFEDVVALPEIFRSHGFALGDVGVLIVPNENGEYACDVELFLDREEVDDAVSDPENQLAQQILKIKNQGMQS